FPHEMKAQTCGHGPRPVRSVEDPPLTVASNTKAAVPTHRPGANRAAIGHNPNIESRVPAVGPAYARVWLCRTPLVPGKVSLKTIHRPQCDGRSAPTRIPEDQASTKWHEAKVRSQAEKVAGFHHEPGF